MKEPADLVPTRTDVYAEDSLETEIILKLKSGVTPAVAIPWDMPAQDVLRWIMACGTLLARADRMSAVVKPALGRLMLIARKDPEFLGVAQCKDLRDFEQRLTKETGYGHTSLHHCLQAYQWAGDILLSEYEQCGWTNMLLLARNSKGVSEKQKKELIEGAKGKTTEELRTWLDETGRVPRGQTTGATLVLTGSQDQIELVRSYLGNSEVQARVGSSEPLEIIAALIGNAQSSEDWPTVEF